SEDRFIGSLRNAVERHYPRLEGLTAIVNDRMKARLQSLIDDARKQGAKIVPLADTDGRGRVFTPVVVLGATPKMRVMEEEIFGPILPIETFDTIDEAIARINSRPRPLAFYYFDDSTSRVDEVMPRVISGGAAVNDTLLHFAQEELPFGGVGASGMGAYHGFTGFQTFSHARSVISSSPLSPARNIMKPPYGMLVDRALDALIRRLTMLRGN
ncbi:MAG: aldehyde dehydrogenase family protein, partial [Archangium sp.]|nr:aldehyde dehydrogenase family protein [Archangium sp.]